MLHFGEDGPDRVARANRCRLRPVFPDGPVPLTEIVPRLERLLAGSPADETENAWLAGRRGPETNRNRRPGTGRAAAPSRSLAGLDSQKVFARARRRSGPPEVVRPPAGPAALVLSQEATAALLEVLNRQAFTSESFHSGVSFLRESLGQPVFHSAVNLRDDAADPRGLPFPFDLLGAACRPLELVTRGVALNLAIDDRLSRALD